MKKCEKCSNEFDASLAVCPNCGAQYKEKKKLSAKKLLITCGILAAVAIIGAIVFNYVMNSYIPDRLYSQVDELIEVDDYLEAYSFAKDVPMEISEELKAYVIGCTCKHVQELADEGKLKDARRCLEDYKILSSTEKSELLDYIYSKCEHKLKVLDRSIATCTEEGFEIVSCTTCGYEENKTIEKLKHKYDYKETAKATCTTDGAKEAICSVCNTEDTQVIKATGHTWGEETVTSAPTCSADGTSSRTCSVCGEVEAKPISATGEHTYTEEITTPATCIAEGVRTFTCSACGDSYTETIDMLLYHELKTQCIHDPGCGYTAVYERLCVHCGYVDEQWEEYTDHQWVDATCEEAMKCSVCGVHEGNALGHDWEWATCTTPNTCKTCGKTNGTATGHSWSNATFEAPKTCKKCGATEGEALAPVNIYADNDFPFTVNDYYSNTGELAASFDITEVEISKEYYYTGNYQIVIRVYAETNNFSYSAYRSSYVPYTIYDSSGNIFKSGSIVLGFTASQNTDDDYISIYGKIEPGDYYIVFSDTAE